ncbi:uncharacterized protein LOC123658921 [Melitaea cinxia]|uniref:uncharacterized protein LOC123658921 n=1 Tax=Melitaea cinxia TaxID=113334 RepID=UPI001E2709D3|nr:uncharacterized protein LOC123658921 [Melitaea cinxia]
MSPGVTDRVQKAKALASNARTALNESKNLKKELKNTLEQNIEALLQLVEEADSALKVERARNGDGGLAGAESVYKNTAEVPAVSTDSGLSEKIDKQSEILLEHNKRLVDIQERLTRYGEAVEAASLRSYASVAAAKPQQPSKRAALHSVIISSQDEKETSEEVLGKIRKSIDAKEGWVQIERVRKARDRRIVMGFGSTEERNKAKNRLGKEGTGLVVEDVKNRDPLVVLRGVLNAHTDDDVIRALRNQNSDIFGGLGAEDDRLQIKYRRRARNPHQANIVLSTSPALWGRITGMGLVRIDFQRVRAEDQSPLVQCTRCLGYGHGRRFCKDPADLCSHCGGPHLRSECPDERLGSPPSCRNCRRAKLDNHEHNAFTAQKILQVNLQRCKQAYSELLIEASSLGARVALVQEPYVGGVGRVTGKSGIRVFQPADQGNGTVKAAIIIFGADFYVKQYPELTTNNITVVGIRVRGREITLVSFYFEPDLPMDSYLAHLRRVQRETGARSMIVGGDANAKCVWWGSPVTDRRGVELCGTLEDLGLSLLNQGETPTFDTIRGGVRYSSYIDITAVSLDLLGLVDGWRVCDDLTSSDHNGISFLIRSKCINKNNIRQTTRKFYTKKANWARFAEKLGQIYDLNNLTTVKIQNLNTGMQQDNLVSSLNNYIEEACTWAIPLIKRKEVLAMPWWNEELAALKREVVTRRRRIRCAAPIRRDKVIGEYLEAKERYRTEIKNAQMRSWVSFCERQDGESVWGGIYRVLGRTTRRDEDPPLVVNGMGLDARGSARLLAETFYPEDSEEDDSEEHRRVRALAGRADIETSSGQRDPPFTHLELKLASRSFDPKKAPGGDGFTADICLHAIELDPDLFLCIFNKCLELHCFPRPWKEATVIFLRKPGKNTYTTPKSYRPIGLLPMLGKILEKMLVARLQYHLVPRLSTRQFGFMPQRSTEDALYTLVEHIRCSLNRKKIAVLVSLDIEGAFDSAWWPKIKERLAEERCPDSIRWLLGSYLSDRRARVRYLGEEHMRDTGKGCVQWGLSEMEAKGDYAQAFADDVVLLFEGETALEIERRANAALERVRAWGQSNKLRFAPHKTNAMLVTRKLKYDTPRLRMGGVDVVLSSEIKLLGVVIDHKLTFNGHVANVCKRAVAFYHQLARAARASWGLHPEVIRTIYRAVVEPVILYAAAVWSPAVSKLEALQGIPNHLPELRAVARWNTPPRPPRSRSGDFIRGAEGGAPAGDRGSGMSSTHPACHVDLEFQCLVDREQFIANSEHEVNIFTDGSKIEGKVGAALSVWTGAAEARTLKLALPSYCTVYQAELLAICRAARMAADNLAGSVGIYSDSLSALLTLKNPKALHPLAVEAREHLRRALLQDKHIELFWIKVRAGLEGNERADHLAKEAPLKSKRAFDYDSCPVSFIKRSIRMQSLDEWNQRYRAGETAGVTRVFFPDATAAHRIIGKIKVDRFVTQVLTGHGGFSEYLYRFKCKESPSCVCDPECSESVLHVLLDYPALAYERLRVECQLGIKLRKNILPKLLEEENSRKLFLQFCKEIAVLVNNRNRT